MFITLPALAVNPTPIMPPVMFTVLPLLAVS
jgi:hypothetical protein